MMTSLNKSKELLKEMKFLVLQIDDKTRNMYENRV
jgi:hypothetical protein